ncbi:MAG: STAS domain-containing protein [Ignavibacteria bacterium]|nr:STAS domain-containing protein [Ignavibacteria bacterium]
MLDIRYNEANEIAISGRFDITQVDKVNEFLAGVDTNATLNFRKLDYISSAGMGVLLATQKRLSQSGHKLKIREMNLHIRDVFRYARFDVIFEIE